jgi:HAMP domain-containing protein
VTLLIIGGLLIVALLAILGAVFLSVSDQRAEKARNNGELRLSSTSASPMITQKLTENRAIEQSTATRQNIPSSTERSLRSTEVNQQPYAFNGQFHELTVELQTLYNHAWELERRLRTLAEVADRIEKTDTHQIGIEEEIHTPSSADSTL